MGQSRPIHGRREPCKSDQSTSPSPTTFSSPHSPGVFVRTASFSGRMDLTPALVQFLQDLTKESGERHQPFVAIFFGNPYTAAFLADLPAVLLTYDFYDLAEASAVRAIAGETAIGGRLPIGLGDEFLVGHGLIRDGL